jgi:hypothetical protein
VSLLKILGYIFRKLTGLESKWYGALYLLLIPTFAEVYTFLPEDFYHTTVQYENTFGKERNEIVTQLQGEIRKTFTKFHEGGTAAFNGWVINANSFELKALNITDTEVIFQMDMEFKSQDGSQNSIFTAPTIRFPLSESLESVTAADLASSETVVEYKPVVLESTMPLLAVDGATKSDFLRIVFPAPAPKMNLPKTLGYESSSIQGVFLPISRGLNTRIIKLEKALGGFPSDIKGNFWRMLYFSAVTVTTIGYGDILPLTTRSRILITVEGVFGIVLAGLFLNAIAQERTTLPK